MLWSDPDPRVTYTLAVTPPDQVDVLEEDVLGADVRHQHSAMEEAPPLQPVDCYPPHQQHAPTMEPPDDRPEQDELEDYQYSPYLDSKMPTILEESMEGSVCQGLAEGTSCQALGGEFIWQGLGQGLGHRPSCQGLGQELEDGCTCQELGQGSVDRPNCQGLGQGSLDGPLCQGLGQGLGNGFMCQELGQGLGDGSVSQELEQGLGGGPTCQRQGSVYRGLQALSLGQSPRTCPGLEDPISLEQDEGSTSLEEVVGDASPSSITESGFEEGVTSSVTGDGEGRPDDPHSDNVFESDSNSTHTDHDGCPTDGGELMAPCCPTGGTQYPDQGTDGGSAGAGYATACHHGPTAHGTYCTAPPGCDGPLAGSHGMPGGYLPQWGTHHPAP